MCFQIEKRNQKSDDCAGCKYNSGGDLDIADADNGGCNAADAEKGHPLSDDEVAKAHAVIVDALNEKLGSTLR